MTGQVSVGLFVFRAGLADIRHYLASEQPPTELRKDLGDGEYLFLLNFPALGRILKVAPGVATDPRQFFELGQPNVRPRKDGYNALLYHN